MARSTGWTFLWALVLGGIAASTFLLYGPYLEKEINRRVAAALEKKDFTLQVAKGGEAALAGAPKQAVGPRFALVAEGGKTFLADLHSGRVWRYFHYSKAEGWSKDVEGFAPLPFFQGTRKFSTAAEAASAPESGDTRP
jgi:hypothetical protein